jgi:hypothetical protein
MRIGIVGLPFSGKTTLFQSITNLHLDDSTLRKETNQAIVKVPDKRLEILSSMFSPLKKTYATIDLIDLVSPHQKDDSTVQFTNNFLSLVRTHDALLHVVKGFDENNSPQSNNEHTFIKDIGILETEFIISDMALVETRMEKLRKTIQKINDENAKKEFTTLSRWLEALQNETPLREVNFTGDEIKLLKNYSPLSAKPLLVALNLDESALHKRDEFVNRLSGKLKKRNIKVTSFSAKIEMELSQLHPEESEVFMNDYGINESALDRLIGDSYELLGLQSFFTVGEDECRAWTIRKGMTAQEAASVIHSDFYKTFIRAEVVSYSDFIEYGSFPKCREKGVWRLEGKEYIVKDGDIFSIRHS